MHEEPPPPTTVLSSPCPHLTIAGNRPNQRVRRRPTLTDNCPGQRIRPHPTAKNLRIAPQHSRHGRNLAVPKATAPTTVSPSPRPRPTLIDNRPSKNPPPPDSHRQPSRPKSPLPLDSEKPPRRITTLSPRPQLGLPKRNCLHNRFTLSAPSHDTHRQSPQRKVHHPTAKSLRIASQHSHPGPHPGQLKRNRPDNRFILFAPSPDTRRQSPPAQESATTRHSPATASAEKSAARQRKASHRTTTLLPRPHHSQPKRNRPDNRFTLSMPSPDTHGNRPSEKFAVRKKYEIFGPEFGL